MEIGISFLVFEGKFTLGVVNMIVTNFFGSSSSGTIILGKLEEIIKGLLLEKTSISTKFVERLQFLDFSK